MVGWFLERTPDLIEDSVALGGVVTNTVTISNTGQGPFDFGTNIPDAWAAVTPSNGTLIPGASMDLSVVFDSNATAGVGTYSSTLSFTGTFTNSVAPVDLVFHVENTEVFMPALHCDSCTGTAAPPASLPWFVSLFGLTAVYLILRR